MPRLVPALLRDPTFRWYFIARTSSHFGDGLIGTALVFGSLRLGASPTEVGLVLLVGRLPVVVFTLVGGVVGDLVSRRAVMLAADVVRCASQGLTAALPITGAGTLWHLAALQAVAGAANAFFAPAAAGLVVDVVPQEQRFQANAWSTPPRTPRRSSPRWCPRCWWRRSGRACPSPWTRPRSRSAPPRSSR